VKLSRARLAGVVGGLGAGCVLLLSGCGGGTSPAAVVKPSAAASGTAAAGDHTSTWDITKMNPCRTTNAAEVSKVVGRTAAPGVKLASWPPMCQFILQPGATLLYVSDNPLPTGKLEYDQLQHSGQAVEQVSGLGDTAYWVPSMLTLHVMVGTTHLKVIFAGPDLPAPAAAESQAETLARSAITRL
jgi:hypothetical protein